MAQENARHYAIFTSPILAALVALLTLLPVSTVRANGDQASGGGAATYKSKCALCHGPDGGGSTVGKTMNVPDLRSDEVQKHTDAELAQIITDGKNAMPSFKKSLTEDQIHGLVTYIRTLPKKK
jgi:mono/diheme cytochrome c family protein